MKYTMLLALTFLLTFSSVQAMDENQLANNDKKESVKIR